jgi:hypothetical protein
MTIWSILRPLEIFYGYLIYFVVIWYIFPRFGILDQEKSGNPDRFAVVEHIEPSVLVDSKCFNVVQMQGDQIGRIFAHCMNV